jgi:nucleoside-diphosphate-sugar epimerase
MIMNVLLTGITGNLGFAIAQSLYQREVKVLPIVRDLAALTRLGLSVENAQTADLTTTGLHINPGAVDCIVHSAGAVHFEKSKNSNFKMMQSMLTLAQQLEVPIYYVSTAFLWRAPGNKTGPRNAYEHDKLNAEKILKDSGLPHTIFRPSVLTGDQQSGQLINWTGYYILASQFLAAAQIANDTKIRFPLLTGTSNMISTDQAAGVISNIVTDNNLPELVYVANPTPPSAQWVLETTLEFFGIKDRFEFIDIDFTDYKKLARTSAEESLCLVGQHFSSYWSLAYNFPQSAVAENLITRDYLRRTLQSFQTYRNQKVV